MRKAKSVPVVQVEEKEGKGKRVSLYTVALLIATIVTAAIRIQGGAIDTPYWQHMMLDELTPFVFGLLTVCSFLMD